jgi:hypothetical protein
MNGRFRIRTHFATQTGRNSRQRTVHCRRLIRLNNISDNAATKSREIAPPPPPPLLPLSVLPPLPPLPLPLLPLPATTVVLLDAVPFAVTGSAVAEVTVAVEVKVPAADAAAVTVTVTVLLAGKSPRLQETSPVLETVQLPAVADAPLTVVPGAA